MKKRITLALAALIALGSLGYANTLTFKVGYFVPGLKSDFWTDELANMSFTKANFQDAVFGFSYEAFLTRELSIVLAVDTYSKSKSAYYKDYVGTTFAEGDFALPAQYYSGDFTPTHRLSVSSTSLQFSLKIAPFGRRAKVIPYVGGGFNVTLWSLRMEGDLIDFGDQWFYDDPAGFSVPVYPIYVVDAMEGENFGRLALGGQVFGGVQIPVANRLTIEIEGKYTFIKGKMGTDPNSGFTGFSPLDLGGVTVSLGINYWF
jgi:hypothetical protein